MTTCTFVTPCNNSECDACLKRAIHDVLIHAHAEMDHRWLTERPTGEHRELGPYRRWLARVTNEVVDVVKEYRP